MLLFVACLQRMNPNCWLSDNIWDASCSVVGIFVSTFTKLLDMVKIGRTGSLRQCC